MSVELLEDLQAAISAGDSTRARAVATYAIKALSPSGVLLELAAREDLVKRFAELDQEFGLDEAILRHLEDETLVSRIEDDLARAAPALSDVATAVSGWAIPLLSALAGPGAPLLSVGLQVAVKVLLAVFKSWAAKRAANLISPNKVNP